MLVIGKPRNSWEGGCIGKRSPMNTYEHRQELRRYSARFARKEIALWPGCGEIDTLPKALAATNLPTGLRMT
jgi:hypothetical protein